MELFVLTYLQSEYFWTTLAFVVLLGVMWRFVVPAVLTVLDARAAQIAGDLDAAARNRMDAETTLADYTAQLAQAKKDAAEIISRARAEAEALASERIQQVERELARKVEDAHKGIAAAKNEALRTVREDVAGMVVEIAGKLLQEKVDAKEAAKLTDKALDKTLN